MSEEIRNVVVKIRAVERVSKKLVKIFQAPHFNFYNTYISRRLILGARPT